MKRVPFGPYRKKEKSIYIYLFYSKLGADSVEEKITLDRAVFKTLSSDTRISILKSLGRRRKTLSELSKEFGMSVSTIKEHLENLCKVDLILQVDDGHKWKYYELTRKGKNVVHPSETRIWIVIGMAGLAIIFTSFDLVSGAISSIFNKNYLMTGAKNLAEQSQDFVARAPDAVTETGGQLLGNASGALPEATLPATTIPADPGVFIPYMHIILLAVFTVLFGLAIGYMVTKRRTVIVKP